MMYTDTSRGRCGAKDPAVVRFGGRYFLYYSIVPSLSEEQIWNIGIAESGDLENWTKIAELNPLGEVEASGICAPGALVFEGKVHLFYQTYGRFEKDSICHAWSEDGVHFTRNQTNPIVKARGNWNNGRAIDADVVMFQKQLYLYFATRDPCGKVQMQGVTRAPLDGIFERDSFQQCCQNTILGPELPWEQNCIEAAATLVRDNQIYMFYAGAYNNSPQQIGVAVSEDGVHFKRISRQPFLTNGKPGSWNESESGHPYIFEDEDGKAYLFYQGNNDRGKSWYLSQVEVEFEKGIPKIKK